MADFYDDVLNDGEPSATADAGEKDILTTGRIRLEKQIQALQDALERRSQMPFDPMMMSVAAGLLKPTKTGSFGESLGYAAEGAVEAAEKERARRSELEKMKLELALKQYELAGDVEGQRLLGQMMTGQAPTIGGPKAPPREGGAPVSGAPTEVTEGGPKQDLSVKETVELVKQNPSSLSQVTLSPEKVAAIYRVSPKYGTIAQKMYDNQVKMAGVKTKEQEVEQKEYDMVEVQNPVDPGSTLRVSRRKARELDKIDPTDMKAIYRWMASTKQPGFVGKDFSELVPEGFKPPPTAEERKIESEAKIKLREKQMQERADFETVLNDSVGNANENIQRSLMAKGLATDPKTKNAFGIIASKPGMQGAVLQFLKDPIHFGEVHVGISNIEDLIRQGGGTQQEIEAAQALDNILMPIQLSYRRNLMKGTGPVSDMETAMTNKMSAQLSDTARIIQFKSDMIIARSEYDKLLGDVYQRWSDNNTSGTMSQFRQSKDFKDASDAYMNQLRTINNAYFPKSQLKPSQKSSETTSSSSIWQKIQSRGKE